ncbi:MAG: phosphoglycerate dehydrogenase [Pirellulales bacterium]|jgi:D-3-phosphoglycerate dehydrogenase|nr:phosphoglycerate dehydrogenase [Pirellulales bacterium]MDP6676111.1 phosphoglycerate dehydrogenase [Pirellulales bacterium]MEC7710546.1 phosphoglycerate dehydrogenase [Planctomycetota bacterium]MEE2795849.1 phosphoglycerate dehydrogenase [Planctomycetota bacterium]|tara:strand:- start:2613 stop:4262 length:1650 start_codon:yes stop_codon:yes gene_type:complete
MPSIIVLDKLSPDGLALLDAAAKLGISYEVKTGLSGEELKDALASHDGAICRSGVKITADALSGNHRLRAIVRAGVGTDNIDKQAATRQGIVVMNTPAGNTVSTAEHAFTLLLALSRNVAPADASLREHRWDRSKYMGVQLAGKTLGIVGMGRIGQAVASRARAFDMRVVVYDPFLAAERAGELGVELFGSVREMLPELDYLTVHTPLTDDTRHLIGKAELSLLKPGVRLINCARGGIYDEEALLEGLESGVLAGAALDVFETEPCTDSPLFGRPDVLVTPHLGASTEEAQSQVAIEGVNLLTDFLRTGTIRHSVNSSPIDPADLEGLRGFLDLGWRLGVLLSQLDDQPPKAVSIAYRGEIASRNTRLITAAFAAGLLETALEDVNIINAEMLLRERGIELVEQSRTDPGAFSSVVAVDLVVGDHVHRAAGTLFGRSMPRLVQLEGHRLEAYLDGTLLIFMHEDVPGIIGNVGTAFGGTGVNIAQMTVGRSAPGGDAIGVLSLDQEPSEESLSKVRTCDGIHSAKVCKLPAAGQLPYWLAAGSSGSDRR